MAPAPPPAPPPPAASLLDSADDDALLSLPIPDSSQPPAFEPSQSHLVEVEPPTTKRDYAVTQRALVEEMKSVARGLRHELHEQRTLNDDLRSAVTDKDKVIATQQTELDSLRAQLFDARETGIERAAHGKVAWEAWVANGGPNTLPHGITLRLPDRKRAYKEWELAKNHVKALGAQYDPTKQYWYVPPHTFLYNFAVYLS